MKPHQPDILQFGSMMVDVSKGLSMNLRIIEIDQRTETVEVIIRGKNIPFNDIKDKIEELGGAIQSVDEISVGEDLINSQDFITIAE